MDLGIKDRLALVTGASRNIGRGIALELARQGARVILVARAADALEAVRQQMTGPEKHTVMAVDLMADGGVQRLVEAITKLGNLDIIVHNLGGSAGVFQAFAPAEDWKKVWQFNVGVGLELNRLLLPLMVQRHWGRIVHLSTLSAKTYLGHAPYVSAKCALESYIKSISREVSKDNVIVSAVAPGVIYAEGRYFAKIEKENPAALKEYLKNHLPIGHLGTAEDVAGVVAFLCSERAAYLAGAIVAVDGGWF